MGLTDLKKELKKLDKDKLVELISDLYKKNKSIKEFFDFYLNLNELELFNKYHDKIFEAFYPKRGYKFKLTDGKQAISDFKKLGSSTELLADLMLFYVETGVNFTNDYGDVNEAFYSSLTTVYVQALSIMRKENLLDKFAARVKKVVSDTRDIGWGFHDFLEQAYFDYYPDDFEEDDKTETETKLKIINLGRQKRK